MGVLPLYLAVLPLPAIAAVALLALPACASTPRATAGSTIHPREDIAVNREQLRLRMRALVDPMTGQIEAAADAIAGATTNRALRQAALQWKIEAVPALREALFQPDPFFALMDTWVLLHPTRPCPRRQLLSRPGLGCRRKGFDQTPHNRGDIVDGGLEGSGVRLRRFREAGDLPHELERRRPYLFVSGWRLEVEQRANVTAHSVIVVQDGVPWKVSQAVTSAAGAWITYNSPSAVARCSGSAVGRRSPRRAAAASSGELP